MSEVVVTRLPELAERANEAHRDVQGNHRRTWTSARGAGEALLEAKAVLEHGEWLPWLRENFDAGERTAQLYMRVSEGWELIEPQLEEVTTLRGAIKLLSNPRTTGSGQRRQGKERAERQANTPVKEVATEPPEEAPSSCLECHRLGSELETERAWSRKVLEQLGVKKRTQVAERIAQLRRGSLKVTPTVAIKDTESIQDYERRKRKAEQAGRPSAMY